VYGARRILKNAPIILQSFFSLPKYESNEMDGKMARARRWNEKNFSIIVLAQRLVSERVRKGCIYTLGGKVKALG
jgi:hypothetical protein